MSKSNSSLGLALIVVGIIGILGYYFNFNIFSMSKLWPLFLLVPGLAFEFGFFMDHKNSGLLVPGGILITLGIVFLFNTYTNWYFAGQTWPFYVLAPAIGLFQLFLFGNHNPGLLIPVGVLTVVAVFGFLGTSFAHINHSLIWPIVLILVGLMFLFNKPNSNDSNSDNPNSPFSK